MENIKNDLKISVENLKGSIELYDREINRLLNEDFSRERIQYLGDKKFELQLERERRKIFIAILERLDQIDEKLDKLLSPPVLDLTDWQDGIRDEVAGYLKESPVTAVSSSGVSMWDRYINKLKELAKDGEQLVGCE